MGAPVSEPDDAHPHVGAGGSIAGPVFCPGGGFVDSHLGVVGEEDRQDVAQRELGNVRSRRHADHAARLRQTLAHGFLGKLGTAQ